MKSYADDSQASEHAKKVKQLKEPLEEIQLKSYETNQKPFYEAKC